MSFLTEPEPARGVALEILPGIRRVVARNPSVMTYWGTNTFLLHGKDGVTVLDPGPDDAEHVRDVLRAVGDKPIIRLVLTHAHFDHHGAMKALQSATGAPSWGYYRSGNPQQFVADHALRDGDDLSGMRAVYTPGHALDHLSFAYQVPGIGQILFSGDHVMAWSSSIVDPPKGNMKAYYDALELLLPRPDEIYLPAHGPMTRDPKALVRQLLEHRQMREAAILAALAGGPRSVGDIAEKLYAKTDEHLKTAAQRNVLAHLLKLEEECRAISLSGAAQPGPSIQASLDDAAPDAPVTSYQEMALKDARRQFRRV